MRARNSDLSGGPRLYDAFMNKNNLYAKKQSDAFLKDGSNICISIQLKNSQKESGKKYILNEEFIKVIEYEYAVRYLEILGINPTQNNITVVLKKHPLSNCELQSGWNNSG